MQSINQGKESLYVNLLTEAPIKDNIEYLTSLKSNADDFRIIVRDTYMLLSKSIRNSKVANNLQKLDVIGTVRNWNILNKILVLIKSRA